MSEANKALARRFYDEINKGNLAIIDELLADGFVDHEEIPGIEPAKAGIRQWFTVVRTAFPDLRLIQEDVVAEGDKVFIRARMTGTHRGEFMGIPATGKQIDVPFADIIRVAGGQAVEHWGITDTGAMMQQLGVGGPPSP